MSLLTVLAFLGAFYLGLAFGLSRAARSWQRGYATGARAVTERAIRALEAQAEWFGTEFARLAGQVRPVPMSDEVQAEMRKHGEPS